ncbi:MAG TPA: hypothetical protein VGJ17_01605 [Candidatus Limnocylindrales bacterium]
MTQMDLIILAVFAIVLLLGLAAQLGGAESRSSFVDPRVADTWAS